MPQSYLRAKGVSDAFIGYLERWEGFVADSGPGVYTEDGGMVTGEEPICFATVDDLSLE